MPENNCFQKVFENNLYGPIKDIKAGFQIVSYNTTSDKLKYKPCVKMLALQARGH